jgi:hypothetical protein
MEFLGKNLGRNFVWVWIPVLWFHLDNWLEFIFQYIANLGTLIDILAWIILSYASFLLFWYDLIYWSRSDLKSSIFKVLDNLIKGFLIKFLFLIDSTSPSFCWEADYIYIYIYIWTISRFLIRVRAEIHRQLQRKI